MAEGDAIFPEEATITIGAVDDAVTAGVSVEAEITNFSESGGEEETESVPVFGGGNIDLVKPRTQIEVSFDVVLRHSADSSTVLKWDSYKWGDITSDSVDSAGSAASNTVYIEFTDGTNFYTRGYNNAKGVQFEPESSADDMLRGTMTFKLSPTDATGNANLKVTSLAATTISW